MRASMARLQSDISAPRCRSAIAGPGEACLARVARGDHFRRAAPRLQRAFHVSGECVADMLASELKSAQALVERLADRRDLSNRGAGVSSLRPLLSRPIHETGVYEAGSAVT